MLIQSSVKYDAYMGKRMVITETGGRTSGSEPGLRKNGSHRVDRMRAREELIRC